MTAVFMTNHYATSNAATISPVDVKDQGLW
jgi:hypothetical protein